MLFLQKSIAKKVKGVDYRLLIASAYSGFVVWHAGLSGSIPLTITEVAEAVLAATGGALTESIGMDRTVLFSMELNCLPDYPDSYAFTEC